MATQTITGIENITTFLANNPNARIKNINANEEQLMQLQNLLGGGSMPAQTQKQGGGNFITNIIEGITDPFVGLATTALEAGHQGLNMAANREDQVGKARYMDENEFNKLFNQGDISGVVQDALGASSFFVPGGAGVKAGLGLGAASGAMGGLSQADLSNPESAISDVITGGLLGAVTGGAANKLLSTSGRKAAQGAVDDFARNTIDDTTRQGNIVSNTLRDFGEDRYLNALKRQIDASPTTAQGGKHLLRKIRDYSKELDVNVNSPESVLELSNKLFNNYGRVIRDEVGRLSTEGVTVSVDDLLKDLNNTLDNALLSDKNAIQKVIDDIQDHISTKGNTPISIYSLKQDLGSKGGWSNITDPDLNKGLKAYKDAYISLNSKLEDLIGTEKFRRANDAIETSIKARQLAEKGGMRVPSGSFNDPLQDISMFGAALGGAPGAAAGAAAGKFMQGADFEKFLGGVANRTADAVDTVTNPLTRAANVAQGSQAANVASRIARSGVPLVATQGDDIQQDDMTQNPMQTPPGMDGGLNNITAAVNMGPSQEDVMNLRLGLLQEFLPIYGGDPLQAIEATQAILGFIMPQMTTGGGENLNTTEQKFASFADSAEMGLNNIRQSLQGRNIDSIYRETQIPDAFAFMKSQPSRQFEFGRAQLIEAIGRLLTGAAITQSEEKRFRQLIPSFGDDQNTIDMKLNEIERMFMNVRNRIGGGSSEADIINLLATQPV